MKTHFLVGLFVSVLLASTAIAQQNRTPVAQPSAYNQPTRQADQNTPRPMSGEEMRRFYSINKNSPRAGVTRSLGDTASPYDYQQTDQKYRTSGPPVGHTPGSVQRTAFVSQDEPKVPEILAGKQTVEPVPPTTPVEMPASNPGGFQVTQDQNPAAANQMLMLAPTIVQEEPEQRAPRQTAFEADIRQETGSVHPPLRQPKLDIRMDNPAHDTLRHDDTMAEHPEAIPYDEPPATNNNPAMIDMTSTRHLTDVHTEKPAITCVGPAIRVEAFGPKSISIGKPAQYEIRLQNAGRTESGRILVHVEIPQWVDLSSIGMTNGTKEIDDEDGTRRLIWSVAHVEPGQMQKLTLSVIPIRAEVFDLNLQWSLVPIRGATQIEVTQPKLEMAISGPEEVLYGETVLYNVTVRNPGTGIAENASVMLSEALGGERAALGNIKPGEEKNFQVELIARSAGQLELSATVTGDDNLQDTAVRNILVRRGNLEVAMAGPRMKYSGSVGTYTIVIANSGDAIAKDVFAAIGLPAGVTYLSGLDGGEKIDSGLRWQVGSLPPGEKRAYKVSCQLNSAGEVDIEAAARGAGDLADAAAFSTNVETVADLVLAVTDPKGPLPIGQDVTYTIKIKNRGTKVASVVDVVMHFAEGIEPISASGKSQIGPGEVKFAPITRIEPNEEVSFTVSARANVPGAHEFRAQLTCTESDSREVAGGTTKFFGEEASEQGPDFTTGQLQNEFRNRK